LDHVIVLNEATEFAFPTRKPLAELPPGCRIKPNLHPDRILARHKP
jgi:hypothetical protein